MTSPGNTAPRELISFGEPAGNYSPAVRVGSQVFVAGMIAMKDGEVVGKGDVAAQTRQVLANIETALQLAGAQMSEIVRYRIYLTDMADLQVVRAELAPIFGKIRPAGTLVAVSGLIHPDLKIEIDVDAIIGSGLPDST
jgi:enamine deaminase RidA (YjgF/YER057c/UK114 family)